MRSCICWKRESHFLSDDAFGSLGLLHFTPSAFILHHRMHPGSATTPLPARTPSGKTETIHALIEWGTECLRLQGVDEARLNVELLLAHVLQLKRIDLYTNFDRPLTGDQVAGFKTLIDRRTKREPLQYIMGETEFMGIPLYVDKSVLIPRPETEELVEKTLDVIRPSGKESPTVLDIGTGSGNIPIALKVFAPNASVISIDFSSAALATAARNLERHRITSVKLLHADVFTDFIPGQQFDIIVANPPYVSSEEFASLQPEVRDFEPRCATTDEGDGYRFTRRIAEVAASRLTPSGWLLMEIGYGQAEEARQIVAGAGLAACETFDDHQGIPRIIMVRRT